MLETFAVIAAVTIGLTEGLKMAGLNIRYVPLASVLIAVLMTVVFVGVDKTVLLQGIVTGLTACGLYSGVKTTVKKGSY